MTNRKSTKRALLGSVVAMVLCLAMLVGATFAWFTDTASTGVNKIQAGNLDIEIQDETGKAIDTLAWATKDGTAFAEDGKTPLWEPGCTYTLTPFQIVNKGNLALKYKIVVTGLEGDAGLLKVIKFTYKTGEETFDMNTEGHLTANGGASKVITVSAHMDEAAGNEYMNKTLEGVKFTVYATQDTVESDSFTNQYDENATYPVANVTELKEALTNGGVVAVTKDIQTNNIEDTAAARIVISQPTRRRSSPPITGATTIRTSAPLSSMRIPPSMRARTAALIPASTAAMASTSGMVQPSPSTAATITAAVLLCRSRRVPSSSTAVPSPASRTATRLTVTTS